jgi:hypothetical protein
MRRRTFIVPLVIAVACLTQGCAPVIMHGPDVPRGFSGGVSAVLGRGPTYENGDDPGPFYFGAATASLAYGFRPDNGGLPSMRLGLQAPTDGGVGSDLYIQVPRKWLSPLAAGAGLLAEFPNARQMPYLQAGIKNGSGFGVNAVVGRYADRRSYATYWVRERAQVNWVTLELPIAEWASLHLHGGFASGHVVKQSTRDTTPYIDEDRWVYLGGLTFEFHH